MLEPNASVGNDLQQTRTNCDGRIRRRKMKRTLASKLPYLVRIKSEVSVIRTCLACTGGCRECH